MSRDVTSRLKWVYNINMKNLHGGSAGRSFLKPFFSYLRKLFSKLPYKIFVIVLLDIIGLEISHCLLANHNLELRCVICTGVTLFAPVLHLNCTVLSQSESKFFFMCIINALKW